MKLKEIQDLDVFLKLLSNNSNSDYSYKIVCKYEDALVTLDFVDTFKWSDEFYCTEPKTISNNSEEEYKIIRNLNTKYSLSEQSFAFKQLKRNFDNGNVELLLLYILENPQLFDFDVQYSNFAYNVCSLDKKWSLPIVRLDENIEFISLQIFESEQN